MNKSYYKDLVSLYEAAGMGMAGTPEVVPQEQIADTGADVMPTQQPQMQDPNMVDPSMAQDPAMTGVDPMTGMPIEPTDGSNAEAVLEKEKFKKLFNLYKDLLDYTDVFIENIKFVNMNLLDAKRYEKMVFIQMILKNYKTKLTAI